MSLLLPFKIKGNPPRHTDNAHDQKSGAEKSGMANVKSFPKVSAGGCTARHTGRELTGAKNIVANRETQKIR
jgi:hypothetical protein